MTDPKTGGPDNLRSSWPDSLTAHRGWLSAVIFARVRDREAVDEVLQETALAAVIGNLPIEDSDNESGDGTSISRWLYRVAVRQSILYRRKRGRNQKKQSRYQEVVAEKTGCKDKNGSPLEILMATEQARLVQQAMRRLSNADREMLLLKYTENWSCREMADRLGVGQSAIKSRLLRARGNLRKELLRISENWETK